MLNAETFLEDVYIIGLPQSRRHNKESTSRRSSVTSKISAITSRSSTRSAKKNPSKSAVIVESLPIVTYDIDFGYSYIGELKSHNFKICNCTNSLYKFEFISPPLEFPIAGGIIYDIQFMPTKDIIHPGNTKDILVTFIGNALKMPIEVKIFFEALISV